MIEKLENNEQILLMYLADELPREDRTEVEQLLLVDGSMRRELEQMQAAQRWVADQMDLLDEMSPLPVSADFAARQVGRAMRQQLARPKPAHGAPAADRAVRSWRWLYPTVAAASIAIIAMVWLGHQAQPTNSPYSSVPRMGPSPLADSQNDSDDSLLIQSLKSEDRPASDEDPKQLAEAIPQDEISQYLLSAATTDSH